MDRGGGDYLQILPVSVCGVLAFNTKAKMIVEAHEGHEWPYTLRISTTDWDCRAPDAIVFLHEVA